MDAAAGIFNKEQRWFACAAPRRAVCVIWCHPRSYFTAFAAYGSLYFMNLLIATVGCKNTNKGTRLPLQLDEWVAHFNTWQFPSDCYRIPIAGTGRLYSAEQHLQHWINASRNSATVQQSAHSSLMSIFARIDTHLMFEEIWWYDNE